MTAHPLRDRRILAIEDEYYIAMDLERDLVSAGAFVLGPVPSVEEALALVASQPDIDAALLDINLGGEMAYPVADALIARNIPLVITTGYVDGFLDKLYPHVLRVGKPSEFEPIAEALATAMAQAAAITPGIATGPDRPQAD